MKSFRRAAEQQGQSLSGWLREGSVERLDDNGAPRKFTTQAELKKFFAECHRREKGREPDWEDHLKVKVDTSRARGQSGT